MQIIEKKLADLIPYERNPRKNEQAVAQVANSIREFGFKVPIVVDKNNVIVAGHTRYKAAQRLQLEKVPVIIADDLTDNQVKAFRLADNKTGELAEWDFDLLDEELDGILDIDMSDFGFTEDGYDYLGALDEKFGTGGESAESDFTVVSLTFDKKDGEDVRSYINKNKQDGVINAVLDYIRGV